MVNDRITFQSFAELTVPPRVRLPNQFAVDLDEAEQGALASCTTTEETIPRPIVNQRTSSNATSTSSNATTLAGQEPEREDASTVACQATCGDGSTSSKTAKFSIADTLWQIARQIPP